MGSPDILFAVSRKEDEGNKLSIGQLVVDRTHKAASFPSQVWVG